MTKIHTWCRVFAVALGVSLLAACGGGSSGGADSSSSSSSTSSSASSSSSSVAATVPVCPKTGVYFCDDFENGTTDNWDLTPNTGTIPGAFSVVTPADTPSKVLQYDAGSANGNVIALLKDAVWDKVANKSDYYVEARIRPQTNSTTGNKQLFLLARYKDATNWYFGGLNVQGSTASTQVEAGWNAAGSISRKVQVKRPIEMGSTWYTVRFEMIGTSLTVYLDGEKIGTTTDSALTTGKIGLFTANKSFQIDNVIVGDVANKPVQLTLGGAASTWVAEVGDAAKVVTVTATKSDSTTDTFTAVSDNPGVIAVSTASNVVTLTTVGAGTATVTFTSGSDATIKRTITATIAPAFVMPATTYSLSGKVTPAAGETAAYIDGALQLTFDAAPTLGTAGSIRIFKKSDDSLVDTIKVVGDVDKLGYTGIDQVRQVNNTPISVSGNKVTIRPHSDKLAYGTQYYVAIADGVLTGAKLAGTTFTGIGKAANWSFTTKAAAPTTADVIVDDDGLADFRSVQGALNYVMKSVAKDTATTITVKNGTYEEMLFLRNKNNVTIKGESRSGAVIQFNNYEALNTGGGGSSVATSTAVTGGRPVLLVEAADLLTLDTLTLKNTHVKTGAGDQAETIYFNSNYRMIAKNVDFLSRQDTVLVNGYTWFYNCLIAGDVDFIWGYANAALFENSEIRTIVDNTDATKGGYLVQARSKLAADRGFVFLNSKLTKEAGVPDGKTYLARSGGDTTVFDHVSYINTEMGSHIAQVGWLNSPLPTPKVATAAAGWREYNSKTPAGAAVDVSGRLPGGYTYQLNASEYGASFTTRAQIFSGYSSNTGWNPQ